ncbi:glycosyltransferase family 39 protein [bacterium]|nr:glycosyltransferase family 39 protein [bacterium]
MKESTKVLLGLIIFYLVLFVPFLGEANLFDWDEINFAEAAREILVTGDWLNVQIGYDPFWEKPPLFIWIQACSMKIFGVNAFAARFPNVIIGAITLSLLFRLAFKRYGIKVAITTVLVYTASITPHLYFKSGIIDPLFNLFIFLAVFQLVRSIESKAKNAFFLSGIFLGLAILTKGPAALLIVGLTGLAYQVIYRVHFYSIRQLLGLLIGLLFFPGLWFGAQIIESGSFWFLKEFIVYQIELFQEPVASHGQPFYYHAVVLLVLCLPLTIIALPGLFKTISFSGDRTFNRWMKVLFWVVLILFSLVTTKIVHYSSMCYIPLAFIAGVYINHDTLKNWQRVLIALVSFIVFSGIAALSFLLNNTEIKLDLISMIKDPFISGQLAMEVHWSYLIPVISIIAILSAIILFFRKDKAALIQYFTLNTLLLTVLFTLLVPTIDSVTQRSWIMQLKQYEKKEMAHFTVGFKSYAHQFYTQVPQNQKLEEQKFKVLETLNKESLFDLNRADRKTFESLLRYRVLHKTNMPVSFSYKAGNSPMPEDAQKLQKVFVGNGYQVYERKP